MGLDIKLVIFRTRRNAFASLLPKALKGRVICVEFKRSGQEDKKCFSHFIAQTTEYIYW